MGVETCQKIAQEYYFFLVEFSVSKLDYLLNFQGSIFAWSAHCMSDKSHALETEFTEAKSRVAAYSFLYYSSKSQRILQKCVSPSSHWVTSCTVRSGKMETTQDRSLCNLPRLILSLSLTLETNIIISTTYYYFV